MIDFLRRWWPFTWHKWRAVRVIPGNIFGWQPLTDFTRDKRLVWNEITMSGLPYMEPGETLKFPVWEPECAKPYVTVERERR